MRTLPTSRPRRLPPLPPRPGPARAYHRIPVSDGAGGGPGGTDEGGIEEIRLTLPALVDYARIARLTATGLASRLDFSYDDVEDLRIAIGEACSVLLDGTPGRLVFVWRLAPDVLDVTVRREPAAPAPAVNDLTRQILSAVVDVVEIDLEDAWFHLVKRRP